MKIKNKSAVLLVGLMLASFAWASSAIANSLTVETINHTKDTWQAKECIANCNSFALGAAPQFQYILEASSGTKATLSAYFVELSSSTPPVSCSQTYTVAKASAAVVNVWQRTCGIHIIK